VQAQDYAGAQWSVGLRLPGCRAVDIDRALATRKIVLTWALRGTLHLVAAADVRWMLSLLGPGIIAKRASRYRQLGLDETTFAESYRVLADELHGGRHRTRKALLAALREAGIPTEEQRGYHLLGRAGLEGLICFGPMVDRQQSFVLLDEWIPPAPALGRLAALATLARRYGASHGPATLQDFVWWSGLRVADARSALAAAGPELRRETVVGVEYWQRNAARMPGRAPPMAVLLPAYDEYLLGYRDRSHAIDPRDTGKISLINGLAHPILIRGRVRGSWKRIRGEKTIRLTMEYFDPPGREEQSAVAAAGERYGAFIGKPVETG